MSGTAQKSNVMCMTLTNSNVKKAVQSFTMSKRYINTMLKTAVINILYHRLPINEKEFLTKNFNEVGFKTFKSKSRDPMIRQFHVYMLACKDAIEKSYLKEMYMHMVDTRNNDILENYKFNFQYADEDDESRMSQSGEGLVEHTSEFLKTLAKLNEHEKFDSHVTVKVEFTYHDGTPEAYQPDGFQDIREDASYLSNIPTEDTSIALGNLYTGFHMLKCRARGKLFNLNRSLTNDQACSGDVQIIQESSFSDTNVNQCNAMVDVQAIEADAIANNVWSPHQNNDLLTEDLSQNVAVNRKFNRKRRYNDSSLSDVMDLTDENSDAIKCTCELATDDTDILNDVGTVKCVLCSRKYHAPCQGILGKQFIPKSYLCVYCNDDSGRDSLSEIKLLSRVRLILVYVQTNRKLPNDYKNVIDGIVQSLRKAKYISMDGNSEFQVDENYMNCIFRMNMKNYSRQ